MRVVDRLVDARCAEIPPKTTMRSEPQPLEIELETNLHDLDLRMRHLDLYLETRSHHAMLRPNVQEHQELSICPYSKETYNYNLNLNLKYSTKRLELEGVVRYQRKTDRLKRHSEHNLLNVWVFADIFIDLFLQGNSSSNL